MKKIKRMYKLKELYEYRLKTENNRSISLWYYHYYKYIWRIGLLILILVGFPITLILLSTLYFKIPFELSVTASLVISIVAFLISITTLLITIVRIMDYPIDNLSINKLNPTDDFYEVQFSIKNCGHGKLKLDFAMYFMEELKVSGSNNHNQNLNNYLQDTRVTYFLYHKYDKFSQYLDELLKRIDNGNIKPFYLPEMTKFVDVYFTHDDDHLENHIHKFDKNMLYSITFLFRTTHRVFYYTTRHIQT